MKLIHFFALLIITGCTSQEKVSNKTFEEITLVNKIDFFDTKLNQPKFSCGFLLQFNNQTYAVTAKHLLKIIKPKDMKTLAFDNYIKSWSLYPLENKSEIVICDKLLNENKSELLEAKSTYENDWLLFSIKENHSKIKPLQIRTSALIAGEKLYAVGWTRKMESGKQRVYEFEYYKTIDNRILLKDIIVPEQFGGLSGAPVVDEKGMLVGIVSGGTTDPETDKKYFSPCSATSLLSFLEKL
ncbi:trypsin-like serine protease [Flavobacterium pectinovorum]|uniref:trypsin-like serine protease n=1 Tax=Flavobacterium pectinovorum TaxID=29533 RepID=UPI001FAB568E|nr:trypsin-like serine protease [Flavobacterium pectinovorum]MCI9844985.1 trypsin-like peptidase domain-containing protein [Flavobacterium pectinovorum]